MITGGKSLYYIHYTFSYVCIATNLCFFLLNTDFCHTKDIEKTNEHILVGKTFDIFYLISIYKVISLMDKHLISIINLAIIYLI